VPIEIRGIPSSAVHDFTDPDDYTTAFRASRAELTITARGQFAAKLTLVRLHCLQMQRFWDNLPRILHVAHGHRRASISFLTGPHQLWGNTELHPGELTFHNLDQDHFHQSFGLASSAFMSLPVEDLVESIAERKLRRRQLIEDGNVEISGRDLR
jgi:hypothetical protein